MRPHSQRSTVGHLQLAAATIIDRARASSATWASIRSIWRAATSLVLALPGYREVPGHGSLLRGVP
ncbi:MAG: hypothetical protein AAFO29_08750, partial [Actinomycetota bacterium]